MYEAPIGECIRRLRTRKDGAFGRRECSWYTPANEDAFVRAVARLGSFRDILDPVNCEFSALGREQQERLLRIVDRVDLYWKVVNRLDVQCVELWRNRFRTWARSSFPWLLDIDSLFDFVSSETKSYTYAQDLITWILPAARRWALAESAAIVSQRYRVDLNRLVENLVREVQTRAARMPFVEIDADDVVHRAVLLSLRSNPNELRSVSDAVVHDWAAWLANDEISWTLWRGDHTADPQFTTAILAEFKELVERPRVLPTATASAPADEGDAEEQKADAANDESDRRELRFGELEEDLRAYEATLPRLSQSLTARYGSVGAGRRALRELEQRAIEAVLAEGAARLEQRRREARQLLLGGLLASGVTLPAAALRGSAAVARLNDRMAVCLWLAGDRSNSTAMSGLWSRWESLLPEAEDAHNALAGDAAGVEVIEKYRKMIPSVLVKIFEPPGYAGGEQHYVDAATIVLAAYHLMHERGSVRELPVAIRVAHKQLAQMLAGTSRGDDIADRRNLLTALANVLDPRIDPAQADTPNRLRAAAVDALLAEYGDNAFDAGRLLTWVIGTCLENKPPAMVLLNVKDATKRNHPHVDLHRGRSTLLYKVVNRVNKSFKPEQSHERI